eukprot:TRINITY_DN1849_c0_g3_i1.p1 TRINITY_DN1849_c0_g3~~TRINITY_DN1849_c0_g3_i1.p1  ORF type:complete len:1136 (+),score=332.00 TRINITY_DN1849_c0_g3_i1:335-3409(+)
MRPQLLDNLVLALKMVEDAGVKTNFLKTGHLVDSDTKMILGMIWAIILDFQIKGISVEELSAKEGLLLWCRKKTQGYAGVKVDNFTHSFTDGLAFCALIHKHRPDLIDFDSLSKGNKEHNLRLAFSIAEEKLNIPRLLDVEDMVEPDERSVMTYVSEYFHCFASQNQNEVAGRRIGKIFNMQRTNDQLKDDYIAKAKELHEWIVGRTAEMTDREFDDTLAGVQSKVEDFKSYKRADKPKKTKEKLEVELFYNNLAMKLRANNRPPFEPPAGLALADLDHEWEKLSSEEKGREEALNAELARQEQIDSLLKRFKAKEGLLEQWVNDKEAFLQAQEGVTLDSLYAVQIRIKMMEGFEQEYVTSKPRLDQVEALEKQLIDLNYSGKDEIAAQKDAVEQKWKNLASLISSRKQYFAEQLEKQQRMEDLRIEFARQAKEFDRWLKDAYEKARDSNFGESKEAVEAFLSELTSEEKSLKDASNERKARLDVVHQQLEALEVKENKYTVLSMEDIINRMHTLDELLSARQTAYEQEILRQEAMEVKRKEFANTAQEFVQYIDNMRKAINEIGGEPTEHKTGVLATYAEGTEGAQKLEVLSALDQEMKQMGISNNRHTPYTFVGLTTRWKQYVNFITNLLTSLDEDIALNAKFEEMKREWAHKEELENQKIDFANRANELNTFIQNANEIATDPIVAKSLLAIQALNSEFAALEEQFQTHSKDVDALKDLDNYLKQEGATENTLSSFTFDDMSAKWSALNDVLQTRRGELETETKRQETNDELCKEFASQANHINEWISQEVNKVAQSGTAGETLEAQQADLLVRLESRVAFSSNVEKLTQLSQSLQDARIEDNIYTKLTLRDIEIKWELLLTNIQQRQKTIEDEIRAQKGTQISASQLAELKDCFNHFDRDKSGTLTTHELKACLHSLGEDLPDDKIDAIIKEHGQEGVLSFESFTNFMVKRIADVESKEDIAAAFAQLSNGKETLTPDQVHSSFPPDEAKLIIERLKSLNPDVTDNNYPYQPFLDELFSR